jgi:hypothetical protein
MKEKWKNWTWPNKCGKSRKGSHRSKLKVYQEQWSHKLNQITTFYIWPPIKENMTKQKWKKCTWNSILFVDHHNLNKLTQMYAHLVHNKIKSEHGTIMI